MGAYDLIFDAFYKRANIDMIADQAIIVIDISNDFARDPKTHVWSWHQGKITWITLNKSQ